MYVLDQQIAKQIVSRTMKIIGHNINVMNGQGVILGSGDPKRIGSTHEGALLAIAQNRNVEISQEVASGLHGVKPGINLPLHYQGQIIGVVGITGDPSELTHYGELLKMTAEMIVEQANLQDKLQWENRQREEFILQLIKAQTADDEQLYRWAKQLEIDISLPRVAAIIEISEKHRQPIVETNNPVNKLSGAEQSNDGQNPRVSETLKQVLHLLQNPDRGNLIAMTSMSQLVILKPAFLDGKQWDPELENQRIDKLLQRLPAQMDLNFKIALGHFFPEKGGIARSYQTAQETLALGKQLNAEGNKYLFEDYSLQVLLAGLKHDWRGQALATPYQQLTKADKNGQLRKTLAAYITHFGDAQQCANALFIHRNTLRYRLDKIQQLTKTDIQSLHGLLSLYLGQLIDTSTSST
ncbi:sugar diacid recognition domain-containing protein [Shewanella sp. CG12_big_fil_rev_8_21_14_0_65_47_15]|uniref:sugar diacid recognition domain-containing protein n=1 Tax=Shewanella sp. CG12_big_fil_rev_8_21_14_0_65_47_15 TaxID=1975537 RepID=UPI000CC7AA88|nr:sugar diacid recognition domain-containing protein [Shewanella sp. CG12_big_fil_rev_8_21_14_0_65_47_15]PIW60321.1 MAG: CdaR family transcriptional regulator [Shewanella sp. CG12_big_fil_rev_8_21_14_0_65_47_15]